MGKMSFALTLSALVTNATSQDLEFPDFGKVRHVCVQRWVGVQTTNAGTRFVAGYREAGREFVTGQAAAGAAAAGVAVEGPVWMRGSARPFVRILGGTSGDTFTAWVYGYTSDESP